MNTRVFPSLCTVTPPRQTHTNTHIHTSPPWFSSTFSVSAMVFLWGNRKLPGSLLIFFPSPPPAVSNGSSPSWRHSSCDLTASDEGAEQRSPLAFPPWSCNEEADPASDKHLSDIKLGQLSCRRMQAIKVYVEDCFRIDTPWIWRECERRKPVAGEVILAGLKFPSRL